MTVRTLTHGDQQMAAAVHTSPTPEPERQAYASAPRTLLAKAGPPPPRSWPRPPGQRPGQVAFRLVRGPVPQVVEAFVLTEQPAGAGTRLACQGEIAADLWRLGQWWSGLVARRWEHTVASSLAAVKVEARAAHGHRGTPAVRPQQRPQQAGRASRLARFVIDRSGACAVRKRVLMRGGRALRVRRSLGRDARHTGIRS
jgi:hypothetical protein